MGFSMWHEIDAYVLKLENLHKRVAVSTRDAVDNIVHLPVAAAHRQFSVHNNAILAHPESATSASHSESTREMAATLTNLSLAQPPVDVSDRPSMFSDPEEKPVIAGMTQSPAADVSAGAGSQRMPEGGARADGDEKIRQLNELLLDLPLRELVSLSQRVQDAVAALQISVNEMPASTSHRTSRATTHADEASMPQVPYPSGAITPERTVGTGFTVPRTAQGTDEIKYRYIVGKHSGKDIYAVSGRLIVRQDELITLETVEWAEREGKLVELIIHMVVDPSGEA